MAILDRRAALSALASSPLALGGSLATAADVDRTEWDRRLFDYQRLDASQNADADFGQYRKSEDEFTMSKARIERAYGKHFNRHPEAVAEWEKVWARLTEAEERRYQAFLLPMWEAAIALAMTPAPDLTAALYKIEVIKHEDLDNDRNMPRDPMEIVAEDMTRLAQGRA